MAETNKEVSSFQLRRQARPFYIPKPLLYYKGSSRGGPSLRASDDMHALSKLARFSLNRVAWSTLNCARLTRAFGGRAFREHRTNVGVLPFLFIVRVLRSRRAPGCSSLRPAKMLSP